MTGYLVWTGLLGLVWRWGSRPDRQRRKADRRFARAHRYM